MKLGFSQGNNGNGKLVLTADNLKFACAEIGIPYDAHTLRRAARAFDLYHSDKVEHVTDHTFRVASQYNRQDPYEVKIKQTPYLKAGGYAYCTCQDWMNYSGDQDLPDVNFWCKHSIAALVWLHNRREGTSLPVNAVVQPLSPHNNGNGNGKRVVNECGSQEAKALQDKLNGQLGSQKNSDGRAQALSSQPQLDLSNPFEESESYDIDQIEGRRNGELAWKLSNGEYVISYKGIMTLAEKHNIEFSVSLHDDTNTVIAKAMNGSERVSGKPIYGLTETAIELAKRNAARQLLPYAELKAVEKKFQLESEFSMVICGDKPACWEKAYRKSCEAAGGKPQCDIVIHELVKKGKLRQASCFEYNRIEWRLIYETCKRDAQVERDPKSLNRWSYNSAEFLEKCHEVINQVREEKKSIEANEMPLQTEVKRKLQMDNKLRTWLVESDGTKKEISCREICEQFESKTNPRIVTRLRAGIDSGADFSTVELN